MACVCGRIDSANGPSQPALQLPTIKPDGSSAWQSHTCATHIRLPGRASRRPLNTQSQKTHCAAASPGLLFTKWSLRSPKKCFTIAFVLVYDSGDVGAIYKSALYLGLDCQQQRWLLEFKFD